MARTDKPVKSALVRQAERFERYSEALKQIARFVEIDGAISATAKKIALDALNESGR